MDTNTEVRLFLVLLYASMLDIIQQQGPHTLRNRHIPCRRSMLLFTLRLGKAGKGGRLTDECAYDVSLVNADRDVGQGLKCNVTHRHSLTSVMFHMQMCNIAHCWIVTYQWGMQHGGGLDKNGLSPTKFQLVEQSTLIFDRTSKFVSPSHGSGGFDAVYGRMHWPGSSRGQLNAPW
jgi:hypothetical protein